MSFFETHPDLLVPFREGRRDVLDKVYRAHARSVERCLHALARRYAAQELVQRDALADLVQEIFIRAFSASARASFDGVRSFGPYLNAIAKNCFLDALSASGREILNSREEVDVPEEGAEPALEIDPTVRAALARYLGALSEPLHGVYVQRFVLGNSQEEACRELKLTRGQLRTEEQRLRVGLRKALQSLGILREEMRSVPMKVRPTR